MGNGSTRTIWAVGIAAAASLVGFAAFAGISTMLGGEQRPAIPKYGNVFQSGMLVGWASGAKVSGADGAVIEFEQISHARQLLQQNEFEYGGLKMRISQILQVDYVKDNESEAGRGAARPNKTLIRVTAKVQR